MNMLAGLAKGAGGGTFDVPAGGRKGRRREKEKVNLDLDMIAGGVVDLPKDVSFPQRNLPEVVLIINDRISNISSYNCLSRVTSKKSINKPRTQQMSMSSPDP